MAIFNSYVSLPEGIKFPVTPLVIKHCHGTSPVFFDEFPMKKEPFIAGFPKHL